MSDQSQENITNILDNIKEVITTGRATNDEGDVLVLTERVELGLDAISKTTTISESPQQNPQVVEPEIDDEMKAMIERTLKETAQKSVPQQPAPQAVAPQPAPQTVAPQPAPQAVAPQPAPQTVSPQPAPQTVSPQPAPQAEPVEDDMAALMKSISNSAANTSAPMEQPQQEVSNQPEEKDILEKIDEGSALNNNINNQKSLESQDFSSPAFNQSKEDEAESLLNEQVAVKSMEKLKSLVQQLEPKQKNASPSFRAGITLEDLVMEAMKPEISKWLNDNLPELVSDLVEKEIKKIIPR